MGGAAVGRVAGRRTNFRLMVAPPGRSRRSGTLIDPIWASTLSPERSLWAWGCQAIAAAGAGDGRARPAAAARPASAASFIFNPPDAVAARRPLATRAGAGRGRPQRARRIAKDSEG